MNTAKKINVNVSSLVGLKAELLRKHTEVNDAKGKINLSKPILPKVKVKNKKAKLKNDNTKKTDNITEIEDVDRLIKSKYMLLAKSKLYDKLKKNHGGNNDNNYMVDFKNKYTESSDDESSSKEDDFEDDNVDPDEDWIDYEDCFGRTRRCLKKDLPRMKEKDSLIEQEISKKPHIEDKEECIQPSVTIPPEKEPEIEIMRKKWEEQTERLSHKTDIHYQDILFDEARAHGVGYYAFSQDDDERMKQQLNLTKLRKETQQKQKELQEIKDLKNKMEENRLKTARIRARIRAGLPPESTEEEIKNDSPKIDQTFNNEALEPKSLSKNQKSEDDLHKSESNDENNLMIIEDKIKAFGELLGKRLPWRELSQEEWIHKRRKDRQGEFAPVYNNFKTDGVLVGTKHNQLTMKSTDDNDDPLRIHYDGPEPTDIWESSAPSYHADADDDDDDITNKLDTSNDILKPEPSTISMNFTGSQPFIRPVSSPVFNPAIQPPLVNAITSLPIPTVNTNFILPYSVHCPVPPPSFINYIRPEDVYNSSLPYSLLNSSHIRSTDVTNAEKNQRISTIEPVDESDSDDSDVIGPMPPPASISIQDNDILAQIPLPNNPPPSQTQHISNTMLNNQSTNENIDKIAAGLKYLREKFDTNDTIIHDK